MPTDDALPRTARPTAPGPRPPSEGLPTGPRPPTGRRGRARAVALVAALAVVVTVAALNLVLDFDFIESGVDAGAPKYMEWYGAFGLVVTLVWLYIELLRLLSKLQSRD